MFLGDVKINLQEHIIENPREAGEIYHEKRVQIEQIREGAVKLYPSKQFESESMRFTSLGYEQLQEKEYDLAEGLFQKALQLDGTNPYAILSIGTIYEAEGKKAEAVQMYKKVIEMNTQSRSVFATDAVEQGRKLTDIAKENLERLGQ